MIRLLEESQGANTEQFEFTRVIEDRANDFLAFFWLSFPISSRRPARCGGFKSRELPGMAGRALLMERNIIQGDCSIPGLRQALFDFATG
jgi:hypothetical protein